MAEKASGSRKATGSKFRKEAGTYGRYRIKIILNPRVSQPKHKPQASKDFQVFTCFPFAVGERLIHAVDEDTGKRLVVSTRTHYIKQVMIKDNLAGFCRTSLHGDADASQKKAREKIREAMSSKVKEVKENSVAKRVKGSRKISVLMVPYSPASLVKEQSRRSLALRKAEFWGTAKKIAKITGRKLIEGKLSHREELYTDNYYIAEIAVSGGGSKPTLVKRYVLSDLEEAIKDAIALAEKLPEEVILDLGEYKTTHPPFKSGVGYFNEAETEYRTAGDRKGVGNLRAQREYSIRTRREESRKVIASIEVMLERAAE